MELSCAGVISQLDLFHLATLIDNLGGLFGGLINLLHKLKLHSSYCFDLLKGILLPLALGLPTHDHQSVQIDRTHVDSAANAVGPVIALGLLLGSPVGISFEELE